MRTALGVGLAAFFCYLIFRRTTLTEIKDIYQQSEIIWMWAACFVLSLGYACRIQRWRIMLDQDQCRGLSWRACAGPLLAGFAANNTLPFRAGDVLRSFAFNRVLGVGSGTVVATLFVERLLDVLILLTVLWAVLLVADLGPAVWLRPALVMIPGAAALILAVMAFPGIFRPLIRALGSAAARLIPRHAPRLTQEVDGCLATLQQLSRGTMMLKLGIWSLAAWLAEGSAFWMAAYALPSISAPAGAWLALPVGTLATLIPSTPGHVGTFDYFTMRAMLEWGNNFAASTAYAFLVHALLWLPPTAAGGLYLIFRPADERSLSPERRP